MRNEPINRIMTVSPATIQPDDSLAKACKLFESTALHHLPVVDNGELVGILSASDFLKLHLLKGRSVSLDRAKVRQLMQDNPTVLPCNASLRDAAEKLLAGDFHALPVVDEGGAVAGIITTSDLAQYLLHHLPRDDGSIQGAATGPRDPDEQKHLLKAVCVAAELYIRSGHADHEHSVLVRRLDEMRQSNAVGL